MNNKAITNLSNTYINFNMLSDVNLAIKFGMIILGENAILCCSYFELLLFLILMKMKN